MVIFSFAGEKNFIKSTLQTFQSTWIGRICLQQQVKTLTHHKRYCFALYVVTNISFESKTSQLMNTITAISFFSLLAMPIQSLSSAYQ